MPTIGLYVMMWLLLLCRDIRAEFVHEAAAEAAAESNGVGRGVAVGSASGIGSGETPLFSCVMLGIS